MTITRVAVQVLNGLRNTNGCPTVALPGADTARQQVSLAGDPLPPHPGRPPARRVLTTGQRYESSTKAPPDVAQGILRSELDVGRAAWTTTVPPPLHATMTLHRTRTARPRPRYLPPRSTTAPDWRWLVASVAAGVAVATVGWAANLRFHLPTVEAVAINVGTAVGLAGVVWVMERRFERRTTELEHRIERGIETVAERLPPPQDEGALRPRGEVVEDYRRRMADRPPSLFVGEAALLADRDRKLRAHEEHITSVERAVRERVNPRRGDDDYPSLKEILARRPALDADPAPPPPEPLQYPADPLDPAGPVRDWWGRPLSLPDVATELAVRLELASLYSLTADAAAALQVHHHTARGCDELLAIALDAFLAHYPAEAVASSRGEGATLSAARWERVSPGRIPGIVGEVVAVLERAIEESAPDVRQINGVPWAEIQAAFPAAIARVDGPNFNPFDYLYPWPYDDDPDGPQEVAAKIYNGSRASPFQFDSPTREVVTATERAIRALRLPGVELPDAVDLSPATNGPYIWRPPS